MVQLGAQQLHLRIERDFRSAIKSHPAIQVDDPGELRRRLDRHGVETWEDELLEGYRRFYAKDPFGNQVESLEPASRPH